MTTRPRKPALRAWATAALLCGCLVSLRAEPPSGTKPSVAEEAAFQSALDEAHHYADALARIETFLRAYPNSPRVFEATSLKAVVLLAQGQYDAAYQAVVTFDLKRHPPRDPRDLPSFYEVAAQAAEARGNHALAARVSLLELPLAPDEGARNRVLQSLEAYLSRITTPSELDLLQKSAVDPVAARYVQRRLDEVNEARAAPSKAEAAQDAQVDAVLARARELEAQAYFAEAADLMARAKTIATDARASWRVSFSLATLAFYRQNYPDAETELAASLRSASSSEERFATNFLWAALDFKLGRYEKVYQRVGEYDLKKIPHSSSRHVRAFYQLASQAAIRKGNVIAALSATILECTLTEGDERKEAFRELDRFLFLVKEAGDLKPLFNRTDDPEVAKRIKDRYDDLRGK